MSYKYADQVQAVGSHIVPATPAAKVVALGWRPRYVRAVNVNNLKFYEYFEGMDGDTSLDTGNHDTAQVAVNAAGGITVSSTGFTLGTDICDTASDVVRWLAIR